MRRDSRIKRYGRILLATALAFSLAVTPALADEIDELRRQKQDVQSQVNDLQSQLNTLMSKISELEGDLIETGEEITQTEEDLEAAQKEQEDQYAAMKLRIKYMYEAGSGTATMEKVLTSGDMSSVLTQAEYSQKVHTYDREKLEEYIETVHRVEELKASLETKMENLQKTQKEYESKKKELNTTISRKSSEIKDLDSKIAEAVRKAAEEEERRRREEARRQQLLQQQQQQNQSHSSSKPSSSSSSGGQTFKPNSNQNSGSIIVSAAYSQLGVPYVWGGTKPYVGFDCSGLTQWCYRQAGISIPRTSGAIMAAGTKVSNPQPGDICWTPGHVAIYIGNGKMIEAQQTGVPVCVSRVRATYYIRY